MGERPRRRGTIRDSLASNGPGVAIETPHRALRTRDTVDVFGASAATQASRGSSRLRSAHAHTPLVDVLIVAANDFEHSNPHRHQDQELAQRGPA